MKKEPIAATARPPEQKPRRLEKPLLRFFPEAYLVGGAVRDHLLGRRFADLDLAASPKNIVPRGRALARELGASFFPLDEENGVYRITADDGLQLDISAMQGGDIGSDLARRDFTVNAIAYPLNAKKLGIGFSSKYGIKISGFKKEYLLDPFCGAKDIKSKTIRLACKTAFPDDPLRLLRAFRARAELGFALDKKLTPLIKSNAKKLNSVSGERIREELLKTLVPDGAAQRLHEIDACGLLSQIFPHTALQKNCAAVYYGKGGVLLHTFKALDRLEFLLKESNRAFPAFHARMRAERISSPLLKLAVLLHDIAKPATARKIDGRLRFFGHEEKGAQLAQELLGKLRFSRAETKLICAVIREHMRPGNLAANTAVSDKAVYRFFRDLEGFAVPTLLACWADHASYMPLPELKRSLKRIQQQPRPIKPGSLPREGAVRTIRHLQVINQMLRLYFKERERILPEKILTGNDIMKAFGLQPGPEIGRLLELARLAQVQGLARDSRTLLAYLKKNVKS